jgi:hypothetical protein
MAESVTIDLTVILDYEDPGRPRHQLARALFALHQAGEIELARATSGTVVDIKDNIRFGELHEMLEAKGVSELPQLAYPGLMIPGANLYPGAAAPHVRVAWDAVLATWRTHEGKRPNIEDSVHIETHVMMGRDVFITDDNDLLAMCRRLQNEHAIPIDACTLKSYLARRTQA